MKSIKLEHDHSAKCIFRDPTVEPKECWFFQLDAVERVKHRRYVYAICNDVDCRGRVRVAVDALEDWVYSQTGGPEAR
jgi:hypothetical protein